jgi:AcrR family transcriptional regulator
MEVTKLRGRMRMLKPETRQENTKYRLAEAIKACMKNTPVDRITVQQIVDACGVTRQTFYRNFLDKYDLINWYFDKLLLESFAHMGSGRTVLEGLERKFEYIREERVFFTGAFSSDDQNSLKEHDFALILEFYTQQIRQKTGQFPDEEIRFLLEMYCRGSIYMTVKWVLGGMPEPPEKMAKSLVDAMPAKLADLFIHLGLLPKSHT